MSEYEKTNVKGEYPQLFAIAAEHISDCKACAERAAAHHVGVGKVHDDIQMQAILDTTEAGVSQLSTSMSTVNQLITESHKLIKETNDVIMSLNKIENIANDAFSKVLGDKFGNLSKIFKIGGGLGWVIVIVIAAFTAIQQVML